jgi:hypothetical protein
MKKLFMACVALGLLAGCSNQVRYRTAGHWATPPGEGGKPTLYQTYLEGTCSGGVLGFGKGCSDTNSKLKRCALNPDNTLTCVDDVEANKMLNKDLPQQ